ncbi:hypothetical protein A1O1_07817 [Capronia coronata CBS 617.96]|uniref:Chromosome transmission fidelity protein 8 n=1 Tax=Capronia coronata CBS 617.96 TaxID=1182541 RepID=W9XMI5_9EURO|nr:uncharacterized protein A1O1_07817 [Capronia coronata CBS 617.96]EXJ81752.1 hypothetical protein A1O1_07817 [Capronia coronata CBS 617.96]
MPAIQLMTGSSVTNTKNQNSVSSPLPSLLQTPSGLAIVEIQGTIHGPFQDESTEDQGPATMTRPIGRLEFPLFNPEDKEDGKWMKKVYLYVGKHQRLTGEVKKLAKPLAVIRKIDQSDDAGDADSIGGGSNENLDILDIVKYKLLFSGRPEPVGE